MQVGAGAEPVHTTIRMATDMPVKQDRHGCVHERVFRRRPAQPIIIGEVIRPLLVTVHV
jgi:hypothetical protein